MLVNIYSNNRVIPVIGEKGPLFGYNVSEGVISILSLYPWIEIRRTTPEKAAAEKEKYLLSQSQKNNKNTEKVTFKEEIQILETPIEKDNTSIKTDKELDDEIDNILKKEDTTKKEKVEKKVESVNVKHYSNLQLKQMTKKELKAILIERGHTNDEYTGRYHDTVEMLIKKVKATQ